MKIPVDAIIDLLHQCPWGSLASHSTQLAGYPFATALPFVTDPSHCPVFLISGLAEHTRNLKADCRASLLLAQPDRENVLLGQRLTLIGDVLPLDASPAFIDRYLRYQPDAERYLALGDFGFYRLAPQKLRLVAGFGQMGWLAPDTWSALAQLDADQEQDLIVALEPHLAPDCQLLGLDCYGADLERSGFRLRLSFQQGPLAADAILAATLERIAQLS